MQTLSTFSEIEQTTNDAWAQDVEGQLAIDVLETDNAVIVQSVIAGVAAPDLQINVSPDMLTIRGKRERAQQRETATVHHEECFWGAFSRTVVLPHPVRADQADAELKDGVLTVTLPKEGSASATVPVRTIQTHD